jgi:hypothetical protein
MADPNRHLRNSAPTATAFRSAYAVAFRAHLADESETALHTAYELGRDAVSREIGLLELAQAHHAVLLAALAHSSVEVESQRITRAAADFLLEALSAYEMVRRGFTDARETVAFERRQAAMIRRLSTLLADASLAFQARASIEEVLQLVVEQALELTGAAWCVTHANTGLARRREILTSSGSEQPDPSSILDEAYAAIDGGTETTGVVRFELQSPTREFIAVPLATLDGQTVGILAIATDEEHPLTELGQAVLIHIGQMTAAALERAMRYHGARQGSQLPRTDREHERG